MTENIGVFETVQGLQKLIDEQTFSESDLITMAEMNGIDLGNNPKPRLNYLVSLGILRKPCPVQYGKGKGGTRFFQKDVIEVLSFIQGQDFALNEIRDVISERRGDLVKQAWKELHAEQAPKPELILKNARNDARMKCLFSYELIKASVLSLKITVCHGRLEELESELSSLRSLKEALAHALCEDCRGQINQYISDRESNADALRATLTHDVALAHRMA